MRHNLPELPSCVPLIPILMLCSESDGLSTAMERVLRSSLSAALTSSGYVSLPGLTAGWSPPGGNEGLGCGESPLTSTGMVPK